MQELVRQAVEDLLREAAKLKLISTLESISDGSGGSFSATIPPLEAAGTVELKPIAPGG